jgi:hypothetical protein
MKKRILFLCALIAIFAVVLMAQTNSGIFRVNGANAGVFNGPLYFEATAGSGPLAGILGSASNTLKVVQTDGATAAALLASSATVGTAGTTAGSVVFNNATSGSITLSPPTGALGSVSQVLPDYAAALPAVFSCGSTGTGSQTCAPATANGKTQIYNGQSTLSSNAATITFPNTFTSTTSYFCVANDVTTRANPVQMVPASATTATITNTTGGSDVIQWVCVGN